MANWIVGNSNVTAGGALVSGGLITTWTLGSDVTVSLGSGAQVTYVAYGIIPAVASGTAALGHVRIDEMRGSLFFNLPKTAALAQRVAVGVGVYVAESSQNTTVWTVLNPLDPPTSGEDLFLLLKAWDGIVAAPVAGVSNSVVEIPVNWTRPVMIGGGTALHVSVSVLMPGVMPTNVLVSSAFRVRVTAVA